MPESQPRPSLRPSARLEHSREARLEADPTSPAEPPVPSLMSILSRATRLTEVLPELHRSALDVTGGSCALLFERNPRTGVLEATSGYQVEELRTEPWLPSLEEAALVDDAFGRLEPTLIADLDRQMPDLAFQLGTRDALLIPMVQAAERSGLLVIGLADRPHAGTVGAGVAAVADAYLAAMALVRLRQREERRRDVQDVLAEFSSLLSLSLSVSTSLEAFARGATRVFGADRASVWLHDRSHRRLTLHAASDRGSVPHTVSVHADDPEAPAAVGMRRAGAELFADDTASGRGIGRTVTVPLRGQRRALGTIVLEGVRIDTGEELDLLDRADDAGRHVSQAIESLGLLQDLIEARRTREAAGGP